MDFKNYDQVRKSYLLLVIFSSIYVYLISLKMKLLLCGRNTFSRQCVQGRYYRFSLNFNIYFNNQFSFPFYHGIGIKIYIDTRVYSNYYKE